jgi:hypothetical protein
MPSAIILLFACIALIFGGLGVLSPRTAWWLKEGWQFKNVEPSNAALVGIRFSSLILIGFGGLFLYLALTNQR